MAAAKVLKGATGSPEHTFRVLEGMFGEDPRFRLRRTHAADPYTRAACGIAPHTPPGKLPTR